MTENNESLDEIKIKIIELESVLQKMNTKMDRIVEVLEKDCKKMSGHIDFVENVYEKVKQPFTYLMDNVSTIMSRSIMYSRIEKSHHIDNLQNESLEELDRSALQELRW